MTKFLCLDFDGTLTDDEVNSLVKKVAIYLEANPEVDVKIGIVTARSVSDDFETPGQFYEDIQNLLVEKGIKLDFISTRYSTHVINRDHYDRYGISGAIDRAKPSAVFGEYASDYLAYRRANSQLIHDMLNASSSVERSGLHDQIYKNSQSLRDLEQGLYDEHINGKMLKGATPKVTQIAKVMQAFGKEGEVMLLDDAYKHVQAINGQGWTGLYHSGSFEGNQTAITKFVGRGFELSQAPKVVQAVEVMVEPMLVPPQVKMKVQQPPKGLLSSIASFFCMSSTPDPESPTVSDQDKVEQVTSTKPPG
jgi:hypothetical protein